jgi:hypothetical protein
VGSGSRTWQWREHGSLLAALHNVLEGHGIELMVVNPAHMKAVPGRKTDVKDAEYSADLLRNGLLRGERDQSHPKDLAINARPLEGTLGSGGLAVVRPADDLSSSLRTPP